MTEGSPEWDSLENTGAAAESSWFRRFRLSLLLSVGVLVVVVFVAASRYQPLSIKPGATTSPGRGSSTEVTVSLWTTLSNNGPFGVDVTALHPKVYADPPLVVNPLQPCFHYFKTSHWCPQDKSGLFTGNRFHPFVITGGNSIPVVWRYSFSCRRYDAGKSYAGGPVEVRVQYRFGFFTHQVLLVLSNDGVAPPGSSTPCAPAG